MRSVTPTQMRQRLGEILDAAASGERILIERDHKPLAVLVSVEDGRALDGEAERNARSLRALDRLRDLAERIRRDYPAADDGLTSAEWLEGERDRRADRIETAAQAPSATTRKPR